MNTVTLWIWILLLAGSRTEGTKDWSWKRGIGDKRWRIRESSIDEARNHRLRSSVDVWAPLPQDVEESPRGWTPRSLRPRRGDGVGRAGYEHDSDAVPLTTIVQTFLKRKRSVKKIIHLPGNRLVMPPPPSYGSAGWSYDGMGMEGGVGRYGGAGRGRYPPSGGMGYNAGGYGMGGGDYGGYGGGASGGYSVEAGDYGGEAGSYGAYGDGYHGGENAGYVGNAYEDNQDQGYHHGGGSQGHGSDYHGNGNYGGGGEYNAGSGSSGQHNGFGNQGDAGGYNGDSTPGSGVPPSGNGVHVDGGGHGPSQGGGGQGDSSYGHAVDGGSGGVAGGQHDGGMPHSGGTEGHFDGGGDIRTNQIGTGPVQGNGERPPVGKDEHREVKNYDTLFREFVLNYFIKKYRLKTELPYS